MANEFQISTVVKLNNGKQSYSSLPQSFSADQAVNNGPSPGTITATTAAGGVNVPLTQLTLPGICRIMNLDPTNYVTVGLYISSTFYPVMELKPGESWAFRFSRTVLSAAAVHVLANTASVNVLVECFDT